MTKTRNTPKGESEEGIEGGDKESSTKGHELDAIPSELSALESTISDMITSFNKKSDGISNDAKKYFKNARAGMTSKINDTQNELDAKTSKVNEDVKLLASNSTQDELKEEVKSILTTELCECAKHTASQHDMSQVQKNHLQ